MYVCLYLPPQAVTSPVQDATRELVHLAREYAPRIELQGSQLVILDMHGMKQLWGSPREIGVMLRRAAADRGFMVRVAVATTKMAALLATQGRSALTVIEPGAEVDVLASLPVTVLKRLAKTQASGTNTKKVGDEACHLYGPRASTVPSALALPILMLVPIVQRWGLKTLGEIVALPAEKLFSRFGSDGVELQRIARGEDSRPLVPEPGEEHFEQTLSLEWPIEGLKPLSIILSRVLEPLCGQLDQRNVKASAIHVRLTLISHETYNRTLQFPVPVNDLQTLRMLIMLDLESHPPSAGIDRVTVTADPVPARPLQGSLFERALPSPEHLSTLLARLSVLMGDRRCGTPAVIDSHHPGAFEMRAFQPKQAMESSSPQKLVPILRRFRVPVTARVTLDQKHGRPLCVTTGQRRSGGGHIVASSGPWLSSGHWWEGTRIDQVKNNGPDSKVSTASEALHAWDREEWDVALNDGGRCRIFRDRFSNRWFVEGVLD